MTTVRQRVLVTLGATLLAVACGALAGYWIGRAITLRMVAGKLRHEAVRSIGDSVALSHDAHSVLDAMNSSRGPICTDADMDFLRGLVYRSHFLKELGRIRNNKIACSTTLGRDHLPNTQQPKPDSIGADGVKVVKDPPLFHLDNVLVTSLQAGDSYVVLNSYFSSLREPPAFRMHVRTTVMDGSHGQLATNALRGAPSSVRLPLADSDGRVGDILYSMRCSFQYNTCMTASVTLSEALQANRFNSQVSILVGGVVGGWLGLFVCLAYRRSRGMEQQLRRAIRRDKLQVVYQPIVTLANGRIVAAESLARWTDEDGLVVGPDVFVRIAEERGFVEEITELMVRRVLRDFGETFRLHPEFSISVNVTARDLADPGFLPNLARMLDRAGVRAQSLSIEITESSTAQREDAIQTIRSLRASGHMVHIDDFGTGYSSLSYLHALSVDAIKIDRAFTQAIGTEAVTVAILPQILAMAASLDLQVIVEGVETRLQADYFAPATQPIFAQGWLFGRPVSAQEFKLLLGNETDIAKAS